MDRAKTKDTFAYFPVKDNMQWVYKEIGGPGLIHVRLEVGPETEQGRELYFHYRDIPEEDMWMRHLRLRDNDVFLVDRFGDEEGPILRLPMSVEQNWAYHTNHHMVVRCYMVEIGDVEIPAGHFEDVIKVEYQYSSGFSEAEFYAPGVGLIGYIERYDDEDKVFQLVEWSEE